MSFFKRFTRPKATLSLVAAKNQLFFGDELKGIVNLKSQEDFDVEAILVLLRCLETVKKTRMVQKIVQKPRAMGEELEEPQQEKIWTQEEYEDYATLYSDQLQLCGLMSATIGLNKDFPFTFKIPLSGRETYHSIDASVRWLVSAYMKIRKRRAIQAEGWGEILVAKPTLSATPTKEVIRELVMIPCSYCGGLMPQSSLFCPNCGARRKG